jgi:hypothetical protein
VVEDYGVIYLGSAVFKIARLLFVAMVSVHLFACIFFRVKIMSAASEADVSAFYTSKNVSEDVSILQNICNFWDVLIACFSAWMCCAGSYAAICEHPSSCTTLVTN